jgi:RNA polymerase sigma-70 factor, ECF subfamily
MSDSETELIRRAQAADPDAFAQLAARYERRIYSLALHYSHDMQDAEDLSQEVWLRAYRAIATFKGESTFYTWIRRITINCFLNQERSPLARWRATVTDWSRDVDDKSINPAINNELALHNKILVTKVTRALSHLTPRQRLIFLLKHQEGMTYEEISQAVGCSTGTAKKAVARALVKLRAQLDITVESNDCVPCAAGQY